MEYNVIKVNYRRDALIHGCVRYLFGLYVKESYWILSRLPDYIYSNDMYEILKKHYPKYDYATGTRKYNPNCLLPAERFEIILKT